MARDTGIRVSSHANGPRSLREPHRYNITITRTDGTPVIYTNVKHVMYQADSCLLILGEHDRDRQYVRYPAHIIDHVISEEIPNDDIVEIEPRDIARR